MNHQLAEATTGIAFVLTLSKMQVNALLRLPELMRSKPMKIPDGKGGVHYHHDLGVLDVTTLRGLERRGLVFWHRSTTGDANGFGGLTRAGRLTVALLREAGLTVDNTNTLRILQRLERHGTQ